MPPRRNTAYGSPVDIEMELLRFGFLDLCEFCKYEPWKEKEYQMTRNLCASARSVPFETQELVIRAGNSYPIESGPTVFQRNRKLIVG